MYTCMHAWTINMNNKPSNQIKEQVLDDGTVGMTEGRKEVKVLLLWNYWLHVYHTTAQGIEGPLWSLEVCTFSVLSTRSKLKMSRTMSTNNLSRHSYLINCHVYGTQNIAINSFHWLLIIPVTITLCARVQILPFHLQLIFNCMSYLPGYVPG